MKNILITGGSGYLGERLTERLYGKANIRAVARSEGKLVSLKQKFPDIEIIPGDISDKLTAIKACRGIDVIYHLAAAKHVTLAEKEPDVCVRSNVIGTLNILEESVGCDFMVTTSTDKAAQVRGVYGSTKLLVESLFMRYNELGFCKYRVVRYGNVLDSTGSVSNIWRDRIKEGLSVKISDPNATRFFWTRDNAIDLIFDCLKNATNAKPYVPEMKSMRMGDLLGAMVQKYSDGKKIEIGITGLHPSENLHEIIIEGRPNSNEVEKYSIEEIIKMI